MRKLVVTLFVAAAIMACSQSTANAVAANGGCEMIYGTTNSRNVLSAQHVLIVIPIGTVIKCEAKSFGFAGTNLPNFPKACYLQSNKRPFLISTVAQEGQSYKCPAQ